MQDNKMYQHSNGSSTLPRGFRFHHEEGDRPTTPEALAVEELLQPSPPRPARLKVRRRNASGFQAPTEQFLASVACADVPIPTIEIPQIDTHATEDLDMPDRDAAAIHESGLLAPQSQDHRFFSPPKTPMPMLAFEEASQRPDWSMGTSSPDEYRPASSHSNASDCSDDSFYSGSRASRPSDDGSCTSPESEIGDPFTFPFPSISKEKGKAIYRDQAAEHVKTLNKEFRSKTRKDAPWSAAMMNHLWSTYMLYVQDPTVTPFRIGASSVPPQGVIHRVAREARRSWKGPKVISLRVRRSTRLSSSRGGDSLDKSGSITPTEQTARVYAQWPHSSSATRNQLRDLCKNRNNSAVQSHHHLQSRSSTPFSKSFRQTRPEEPARISAFSTKDIVLSLTTSTAESMQPGGPLAQLAAEAPSDALTSAFPPLEEFKPLGFGESRGMRHEEEQRNRRLGPPFLTRTYGPSTSKNLNLYGRPSSPRAQSDSSRPFLRSPLNFEPRSLNGTMKRRAQHALEEELNSNDAVLRPSILNEQLFGTALQSNQRRVRSRGFSLGDEALANRVPGLFQRPALHNPSEVTAALEPAGASNPSPTLLPAATFDPPRLGSPFSESGPSQTFPRRLFQDGCATIRRSAFATMHQTRRSIESFDFGEGPSLESRLSNLGQRLTEIRERGGAARRQNVE